MWKAWPLKQGKSRLSDFRPPKKPSEDGSIEPFNQSFQYFGGVGKPFRPNPTAVAPSDRGPTHGTHRMLRAREQGLGDAAGMEAVPAVDLGVNSRAKCRATKAAFWISKDKSI